MTALEDMPSSAQDTQIIDGYRVGRFIGKGSVGSVYEASREGADSVAIKVMKVNPFVDELLLECIVEGALATKRVSAEANVVEVFEAGREGDLYYIVMKLYSGTMELVLADSKMSFERKLEMGCSIAKTLMLVHEAGIVHGDLKPSNLLLEGGQVYLNDFYQASDRIRSTRSRGINVPQGTPMYMSPEQAIGRFIDARSDIYSFGVMFYELLTGRSPYEQHADTISGMVNVVQESAVVPPEKYNPNVSRKVSAVLQKMLAKDSSQRYQVMRDAWNDLVAASADEEISIKYNKSLLDKVKGLFGSP